MHARRSAAIRTALVLLTSALVAVACGGGDPAADGDGQSGIVGDDGPLAWLPADTWLVASLDADAKTFDRANRTLGRLPIWTLVEGMLPASDGKGVRLTLLEYVADQFEGDVTAQQLEDALGAHAGVAAFGSVPKEGLDASVAVWFEVEDEREATTLVREADGKTKQRSHEGHDYVVEASDTAALVEDGLLLVTPSEALMKQLIDTREGEPSVVDDDDARAVLEGAIGDAAVGGAVATDPLIEAAAESIVAEQSLSPRPIDGDALRTVLASAAVDHMVPEWVGASIDVDDTGARMRATWSNPRELAKPTPGARELAERMPAASLAVQAASSDGSPVQRAQALWAEARDAFGLDPERLPATCEPGIRALCAFGTAVAATLLEDESLAAAAVKADDLVVASAAYSLSAPTDDPKGATSETVTNASFGTDGWTPPAALTAAAKAAGLTVTYGEGAANLRVARRSQLGQFLLGAQAGAREASTAVPTLDLDALFSPKGLTLSADRVDDLLVSTMPSGATSLAAASLAGDGDQLADDEDYTAAVEASDPAREVGAYTYVDLRAVAEALLEQLGAGDRDVQRITPTVSNNLSDIPGLLAWTTRETVRGERVGVAEVVVPIEE